VDNSTLYQSQLLSGMAQRFYNRDYIAGQCLTPATVPNLMGQYHVWNSGVVFRRQNDAYGPDGSPNRIDMLASKSSFTLDDHALYVDLDERETNQAPEMAVRAAKARALTNALLLNQEYNVAAQLFSSSVITNGATLSGTDQWSHEDSDPKRKILTAQNGQPVFMETLILGKQTYDSLTMHPLILEAVKYTMGGVQVTRETIARYLGVDRILVGSAFVDSAVEGQTQSLGFVWGKHALLCHVAQGPSSPLMDEVSLGYLPRWGGGGNGGIRVYTGREATRGTGSGMEFIKAEMTYKPLITSVACGYLFTNATG
jgi:hypothetical protein